MALQIVVPVDFSESSKNALQYALSIQNKVDTNIHLIHAYSIPVNPNVSMIMEEIVEEEVTKNYHRLIEELQLDSSKLNLTISKTKPSKAILELADEVSADLIIMGARGENWIKKLILGSTAINVLRNTLIPVITVPREQTFSCPAHILYASDLENIDEELGDTTALAKLFEASCTVFHACPEATPIQIDAAETQKTWSDKHQYPIKFITVKTRDFNASLIEILKSEKSDLLVLYTKKRDNEVMFLLDKSTSLNLVKEIDIPVMIKQK
jgi:nucleotide-binding universal stress UspA family protein